MSQIRTDRPTRSKAAVTFENAFFAPSLIENSTSSMRDCLISLRTSRRFKQSSLYSRNELKVVGAIQRRSQANLLDILAARTTSFSACVISADLVCPLLLEKKKNIAYM